jgi:hypothetical protein
VAVYSERFHHVAIMRKILLWMNVPLALIGGVLALALS